jgi:adenylate cyclase
MGALGGGGVFLFEGFRLDRNAGALFRRHQDGTFVPMTMGSRALDVLDALVERAGDLVSRDEFMAAVWPATAVEDTNLNMQIAALRRVLDEGRADGSCIQTIPGRGYRFAAPVTRVETFAPLTYGQQSGNGTAGPIAEHSEARNPPATCGPANTPPLVSPRERKWLWCSSLALVTGAICLLAAIVTASNWHWPRLEQVRPAPRMSIVVLPFTAIDKDRDEQSLANGLTEDLTTELSLAPDVVVTSRHTAFTYGNKLVDTKQIGRELSVRYMLDGSVQRSGNELRINAQLIDAETDTQLWAERFDRVIGDLSGLQNEITSLIRNTVNLKLIAAEAARPTEHPDALDYILRGRAEMLKARTPDPLQEAINLFEHALSLDPQSVEAQTSLAFVLVHRVTLYMTDSAASDLARADGLIDQALAAAPRISFAHYVKGTVLRMQNRWEEATLEFETALSLNPNSADALQGLGWCKLHNGSLDEVIPIGEQAIRLSPRSPGIVFRYLLIGAAHLLQSHTGEAIVWLEKARSANPGISIPHAQLAAAYALNEETQRAVAELAEARKLASGDRYATIAHVKGEGRQSPKIRTSLEATYFAGLRKAGMPEE